MVRSMTGFGSARIEEPPYAVSVEVRSVNNRNIKVITRVHERLLGHETEIKKILRRYVSRGTFQVNVQLVDSSGKTGYTVDEAAARAYHHELTRLKKDLELDGGIRVSDLIGLPGVVQRDKESADLPEELWGMVKRALSEACEGMLRMREEEGRFVWKDIVERSEFVDTQVAKVEERVPLMLDEYRERLAKRLGQLLAKVGEEIKPEEVHREIAVFTDRADITEEIQRMRSHLAQLRSVSDAGEPVGRKVEFIIQELFREANTMGSKGNDPELIHCVVDIKGELERMREQAFNVE